MKNRLYTYGALSGSLIIFLMCVVIVYHMIFAQYTKVVFLDVGQGDAILISHGKKNILIDGGPDGKILLEELGKHMPFWDRTIEIVVATHPDADHIDGLINVFENYRVQQLWRPHTAKESATYAALVSATQKEEGLHIIDAFQGLRVFNGQGMLHVVYPYVRMNDESDVNRSSIVVVFEIGDDIFYLGGDAPSDVEDSLLLNDEITIAKASHHGSHTSTSAYFLNKIRPRDVIISSGAENRYGHPHDDVLTRAFRAGAQVLRTDYDGSIVYTCDQHTCVR